MTQELEQFLETYQAEMLKTVAYLEDNPWSGAREKIREHKIQYTLTNSLVTRLTYLLTNGGREEMLVNKELTGFINEVGAAVSLYLDNVKLYLQGNDWTKIYEAEDDTEERKRKEIEFQDSIMNNSLIIRNSLVKLNLENQLLELSLPLEGFGDSKHPKHLPFLMRDMLEKKFPKLLEYKNQLHDSE